MSMTKRLFDIDDALLSEAQEALGAESMTETVREALRRVVERDPGDEYVKVLASLDFADQETMWRNADT